jgi:dynein heavy chain, axonemal
VRLNLKFFFNLFQKVNIINFTITTKCLFEQLLSIVVLKERPELENHRTKLLDSITTDFITLRELEDKSLNILSNADTSLSVNDDFSQNNNNILDDQNLIDLLKQSKETNSEIQQRLQLNEGTERALNVARQKYSPIATRGSILYFTVQNLSSLNVMYQFSLDWFFNIFQSCLGNKKNSNSSEGSINQDIMLSSMDNTEDFKVYINSIITMLTDMTYKVVSWSLFAEHQLTFSFSICANIFKHPLNESEQKISIKEYNFFLNSSLLADMWMDKLSKKIKDYEDAQFAARMLLDKIVLRQISLLEETLPDKFAGLLDNMQKYFVELWCNLKESTSPYQFMNDKIHSNIFNFAGLTKFQKLILIKLLRPDALIPSINDFIKENLGVKYLNPSIPTLNDLYNQSLSYTPIIFTLSPGSDPTSQLLRFAKESRGSTLHLDIVSLGQGQGPKSEELIKKSLMLKGKWIFLQNCHLSVSFMPRLQAIVDNFKRSGSEIDKQFRLFLSSKPNKSFPISLLKAGIKMTIEQPRGLKNNMIQNFGSGGFVNDKLFENEELGHSWKRLILSLGFIHALINERKKFGSLGWNLIYEFNNSDLEVAILKLQSILSLNPNDIPFNVLKYMTGEVIYGGRITDDFDRRCLHSILSKFFCINAIEEVHYYGNNNTYKAPDKQIKYDQIIDYINCLPENDDPSVFGMNIYAERILMANRAQHLVDSILSMEPAKIESITEMGGKNEIILEICNEIKDNLPSKVEVKYTKGKHLTFKEAYSKLQVKLGTSYYEKSAMNTVLIQEIDRYNKLLVYVKNGVNELTKSLLGEIVTSKYSDELYSCFLIQKVPVDWEIHSFPTVKPLAAWIKDLIKRVKFFSLWSKCIIDYVEETSKDETLNPYSIWLSAFIFPQGLLAAISQNYARKLKVSIDSLEFEYEILNNIYDTEDFDLNILFTDKSRYVLDSKSEGVIICGLFMDGAEWSRENNQIYDSPLRFKPLPHILCKMIQVFNCTSIFFQIIRFLKI